MSKALPGENYCVNHQGNHSHYAEHNCTVCKLQKKVEELCKPDRTSFRLERIQVRVSKSSLQRVDVYPADEVDLIISRLQQSLQHADDRACEAEQLLQDFKKDIEGRTFMGEPYIESTDDHKLTNAADGF